MTIGVMMMKLAIADPPYLGRAHRWYGVGGRAKGNGKGRADEHPEAFVWDKPESHINLALDLINNYDGFAIACSSHSLSTYLSVIPTESENGIRILSWIKPGSLPSGSRITQSWEPVIVKVPKERKGRGKGKQMVDYLVCPAPRTGFVGSKPDKWTIWILDAMGYKNGDIVLDLFPGSGSVSNSLELYKERVSNDTD
jgi:hypothetical protein